MSAISPSNQYNINNQNGNSVNQSHYKKSRTIVSNLFPCIEDSPECEDIYDPTEYSEELKREMRQHAYQRIQTIYAKAEAVYGLGKRTNSADTDNLVVGIDHARFQIGQGDNQWDAAHSDAAAGLYDNRREQIGIEILNENKITPIKMNVLKSKSNNKFTEADINHLLSLTHSPDNFWNAFDQLWTPSKYEYSSLLEDTYVGLASNITMRLPRSLNRVVDRGLERTVRPLYAELMKAVMLSDKTPDEATRVYQLAILKHFKKAEANLMTRIQDLTNYQVMINHLIDGTSNISKDLLNEIEIIQKKLSRFLCSGAPGVYEPAIPNLFDESIDNSDEDAVVQIKAKFYETIYEIKNKIPESINKMKCYLLFTQEEMKGSQELPEFSLIAGTYIKEIATRMPLSPSTRHQNQLQGLQPYDRKELKRKSLSGTPEHPKQRKLSYSDSDEQKSIENENINHLASVNNLPETMMIRS